jgi:hypothetical protein
MEAKIRAVPYLVAKLWSSDIRPIRTGMRLMYPPLVNPKMMEYAIVAAADEVGNHNANAKMAVLAVHIIMTLNLSQSTAKQEIYGPIRSARIPGTTRPKQLPTLSSATI